MKLNQVFYIVGIVAFIVVIHSLLMKDDEPEHRHDPNFIVIPGINYRFHRPGWWWNRFRRNLPWVGPRPGRPYGPVSYTHLRAHETLR